MGKDYAFDQGPVKSELPLQLPLGDIKSRMKLREDVRSGDMNAFYRELKLWVGCDHLGGNDRVKGGEGPQHLLVRRAGRPIKHTGKPGEHFVFKATVLPGVNGQQCQSLQRGQAWI